VANPEHLKKLEEGVEAWNTWRKGRGLGISPDLRGAHLLMASLTNANLGGANLTEADLTGAVLSWADLYGANLAGADLTEADLTGAVLYGAKFDTSTIWPAGFTPPEPGPEPEEGRIEPASVLKIHAQTVKAFDQGQTIRWLIAGAMTETNGQIEDELHDLPGLRDKIREQQAAIEALNRASEAERSSGAQTTAELKAEIDSLEQKIETLTEELKAARANTFTKKVIDGAANSIGKTLGTTLVVGVTGGILVLMDNLDFYIDGLTELVDLLKKAKEAPPKPDGLLDV